MKRREVQEGVRKAGGGEPWLGGPGQVLAQRMLEDPVCPTQELAIRAHRSSFICSESPGLILNWDYEDEPCTAPIGAPGGQLYFSLAVWLQASHFPSLSRHFSLCSMR